MPVKHPARRAFALALCIAATAGADTPPSDGAVPAAPAATSSPTTVREQLELAVAMVVANEAGFRSPGDANLIWQVVSRFRSNEARLAWLRSHSCRVLGQEYCRRPRPCPEDRNCQWARELTWGDTPPTAWPADAGAFPAHSWGRLRAHVRQLVRHGAPNPCNGRPITWGGDMDAERALEQGLVALDCGETRNTGYARAPR